MFFRFKELGIEGAFPRGAVAPGGLLSPNACWKRCDRSGSALEMEEFDNQDSLEQNLFLRRIKSESLWSAPGRTLCFFIRRAIEDRRCHSGPGEGISLSGFLAAL